MFNVIFFLLKLEMYEDILLKLRRCFIDVFNKES